MRPLVLMILLLSLGIGNTYAFSSSHWLLAWMGLELNTLAVVPLMAYLHHPRAVEATSKYFIIQSVAAATILLAVQINATATGEWLVQGLSDPLAATTAMMALTLKIGLAPIHFWLPEVLQGLPLVTGLLISTIQKLAPFILIIQIAPLIEPLIPTMLGLTSIIVGGWGGINQTQLRKFMAYSSIAHFGWMMLVIQLAPSIALLNLVIYIIMTTAVFLMFIAQNVHQANVLATAWAKGPLMTAMLVPALLSLGGLPPLSGFMPKWLIINEMTKHGSTLTALAALSALISLYYYLRLCYTAILTSSPNITPGVAPWQLPGPKGPFLKAIAVTMAMALLPMTPLILMWFI